MHRAIPCALQTYCNLLRGCRLCRQGCTGQHDCLCDQSFHTLQDVFGVFPWLRPVYGQQSSSKLFCCRVFVPLHHFDRRVSCHAIMCHVSARWRVMHLDQKVDRTPDQVIS